MQRTEPRTEKPYSEACDRNAEPILRVLRRVLARARRVLEIGSGTGQHAVRFARELPHLVWQPSDVAANLPGIRAWMADEPAPNLLAPLALDVDVDPWPVRSFDAVFSANTSHIMSWDEAQRMVVRAAEALNGAGVFCLYGPFNYRGGYTSDSNARFDAALRARDPRMGLRDQEAIDRVAAEAGFALAEDNEMPANNRLLVWRLEPVVR